MAAPYAMSVSSLRNRKPTTMTASSTRLSSSSSKVGFLTIGCGGVGLDAIEQYHKKYELDQQPFANVIVHIDTDPVTADCVDERIHIGFRDGQIDALKSDPERFSTERNVSPAASPAFLLAVTKSTFTPESAFR